MFACLMASIMSCIDDKGSYNYGELNDIAISGIADEYRVMSHQTITPQPKPILEFSAGKDDDVAYSWQIDFNEVCDHEAFDTPVDVAEGEHKGLLVVTNKTTGLRYFKEFTLHVETAYSYGLAILGEDEKGTAKLTFQPRSADGTVFDFIQDVFELENPEWGTLGSNPIDFTLQPVVSEYANAPEYLFINNDAEKALVSLDMNTMKMTRSFLAGQISGTQWKPQQLVTTSYFNLMLNDGQVYSYSYNRNKGIVAPLANDYHVAWLHVGGDFRGYAVPAYDDKRREFVCMRIKEGRNFTYDDICPFNELKNSPQTTPVVLDGLTLVKGQKMYNDGGYSYDDNMFGGWFPNIVSNDNEDAASTLRFIFADSQGKAHFYTYDFEVGVVYDNMFNPVLQAISDDYGVREDRVVDDLRINAGTVCQALPYGRYWLIADGRTIIREYFIDGATRKQFDIPGNVTGEVVDMLADKDETRLFVALYDKNSSQELKGGIAVFSLDVNGGTFGNLLEYYPNVCNKTVKMILKENK